MTRPPTPIPTDIPKLGGFLQDYFQQNASGGAHGSHFVYWVPLPTFQKLPIERWKHNRPEDSVRVTEIASFVQTSKRMDGMIYLACVDGKLVCYESNHRREALKSITDPTGFAPILVDVLWDATDDILKEEFIRLNKAVSVPELYVTQDASANLLDDLRKVVDRFCELYPAHRVATKHPQRPNFSRDTLMDDLYTQVKETQMPVSELVEKLTRLNMELARWDRTKLSPKVRSKCEASGLWLFAWNSKITFA
jgi:hypothetical protein